MSYKALYRVYRPSTFDDIKDQDHIRITLINILKYERLSHAYLFSGPRGTGKTSVARIFAKAINCKFKTNNFNPCQNCITCKDMDDNKTLDIIEIDAASNNGVAEIRQIRDNIRFYPSESEYKVYIIDEIHMLSKGAFNALLKILEEPPKHVIFILATTEASKIPATILSRVQRFNFRLINDNVIKVHLKEIFLKENIEYEIGVLEVITILAKGSLRDALSISDQVSTYTNSNIKNEDIFKMFGIVSLSERIKLLNFIANKDLKNSLGILNILISNGANIKVLTENLIEIIKDFIIYSITNKKSLLSILTIKDIELLKLNFNDSYNYLEILINLLTQLSKSDIPDQNITLAILKMIQYNNIRSTNLNSLNKYKEIQSNIDEFSTKELFLVNNDKVQKNIKKEDKEEIKVEDLKEYREEKIEDIDGILNDFNLDASKIDFGISDKNDLINSPIDTKIKEEYKNNFNDEDIINLLVQFDSDSISLIKRKSKDLIQYLTEDSMREHIELLTSSSLKLLSAGKDFILFATNDKELQKSINQKRRQRDFINTIKETFEHDYCIYVLLLEEWYKIKDKYMQLQKDKLLPQAKVIIKIIEKTDEERYGAELFGKLFSAE